jgi:hypothetical protein
MNISDNLKIVLERLEARGFERKFQCTPIEACLSWNVNWGAKDFNNFANWCASLKLNPHSVHKEVQVNNFGSSGISWYATALGSMSCLIRFGVIWDVLDYGVVYEGEDYTTLPDKTILHEQTANVKDMQLRPLFGYITVQRPTGNLLTYRLTGDQLDDPKRNTKKNVWLTNRHEMYIKSMQKEAFKQLRMHCKDNLKIQALNIDNDEGFGDADDLKDDSTGTNPNQYYPPAQTGTNLNQYQPTTTQTNANQPTTSAAAARPAATANEPDDLPF